jgi:hypothetical protein
MRLGFDGGSDLFEREFAGGSEGGFPRETLGLAIGD